MIYRSWSRRVGWVGRSLWRPSSPTPSVSPELGAELQGVRTWGQRRTIPPSTYWSLITWYIIIFISCIRPSLHPWGSRSWILEVCHELLGGPCVPPPVATLTQRCYHYIFLQITWFCKKIKDSTLPSGAVSWGPSPGETGSGAGASLWNPLRKN